MGPGESAAAAAPPGREQLLLLSGAALAERYRRIYTAAALSEREQAAHLAGR